MKRKFSKIISLSLTLLLFISPALATKCLEPATKLDQLVAEPQKFLYKKLSIEGDFHSYSTLALDYPKALRTSKDFISIVLSRPDMKSIPLVELKIAAPLALFKDSNLTIDQGDKISIKAKVYAVALGEPWLEAESIEIIKKKKST
ncbi:MAG: hypothetical protein LW817_04165 [Candidatus Caenarcaniphilales bacterium]|nr:hypothetical protein [Candidatus Caenarcaniphilales bacterium]